MRGMGAINTRFQISVPGKWFAQLRLSCALLLALAVLSSCATGPKLTDHAFSFDARWDSPDVEVLNYRYGDSKHPGARTQEYSLRDGKIPQAAGINGPMLRGDFLYVKWRIKDTGDVFEDTVDLRNRLPDDIVRHGIYFIIKGPQLHVYLITPEKLNPNPCPSREELRRLGTTGSPDDRIFSRYCNLKITTIYPDKSELQEPK